MNSELAYTYTRLCEDIRLILRDYGTEIGWSVIESAIKSQLNTTTVGQSSQTPPRTIETDENTRNLA
jgi:hypothetical protein